MEALLHLVLCERRISLAGTLGPHAGLSTTLSTTEFAISSVKMHLVANSALNVLVDDRSLVSHTIITQFLLCLVRLYLPIQDHILPWDLNLILAKFIGNPTLSPWQLTPSSTFP